jgi:flagellar hook-associated protein 2
LAISSPGIGSNLDINSIVSQLMQVESQPLIALSKKEASYQAKLSAYGSLSGALSTFQNSAATIGNISKFQQLSASSTDATIASASVAASAAPGKYELAISQLAQAQSIASAGQTSASGAIGAGGSTTVTFQFGRIQGGTLANGVYTGASFAQDATQSSSSITIDSSNNSLQGIRDAINKAKLGVTATIVSDGSAAPHRLVLTSNKTGEASSMKISVAGDSALQDLLAYDPDTSTGGVQKFTQSVAGQDAKLKINGIDISSASNTLSSAVEGLTLTLGKVGSTAVTVTRDTAAIENSIKAFIKSYNDLNTTIKNLTAYNAETKVGGPLVGDSTVRTVQSEVRRMFSTIPEGLTGSLTSLSQVGVSFQKDGSLALDSSKLQSALSSNFEGVGRLFATTATPSDSLISFSSAAAATKTGSHTLQVDSLATKGSVTGLAPANLTITASSNDSLSLNIDGVTATITLAAGTYTADSLAAHVQSAINGASAFSSAGIGVSVTQTGGTLSIVSNRYGSASVVAVSGNGSSGLLGGSPTPVSGTDVQGSINGVAAVGSGQYLTGATGTRAEGLRLQVTGGSTGNRGSIDFSKGYATQLGSALDTFLGSKGLISGRTDGLSRSIKDVDKQRDVLNLRLENMEKRYRAQFTALDVMLAGMTSTSNYLTQQLAALANLSNE